MGQHDINPPPLHALSFSQKKLADGCPVRWIGHKEQVPRKLGKPGFHPATFS